MTQALPPLNALRAFEAAARLQNISQSAAELSVTHGAVSRQIRLLEDDLDRAEKLYKRLLEVDPDHLGALLEAVQEFSPALHAD